MRFDDLDKMLRIYETANDRIIPPGFHIVARLDGRGFTRLTKELMQYEAPYDIRFRDIMLTAMERLMDCGFKVSFAYAQSDEISLLFDAGADAFDRKHRKWISILAAEASATLSLAMNRPAVLDCRIIELPGLDRIKDYFRWRMEDAGRNCLNSHCYWMLRKSGQSATQAANSLSGLPTSEKHQMLFAGGINFNDLPLWQKRGYGMKWEAYEKEGLNPLTGELTTSLRRRPSALLDLPYGDEYAGLIQNFCLSSS